MNKEIDKIDTLNTFIHHDNEESTPKDYKFILSLFEFDVKYDGKRKARLVA